MLNGLLIFASGVSGFSPFVERALFTLSSLVCLWAFLRWTKNGEILPREPRKRVPWGAWPVVFIMFTLVLKLTAFFAPAAVELETSAVSKISIEEFVKQLFHGGIGALILIISILMMMRLVGAKLEDLGIVASVKVFLRDIRLGVLTFLFSIVPVMGMFLLAKMLIPSEIEHPLVDLIVENHKSPEILQVVFFLTIIVAPISEEYLYRVFFQGWWERYEDEQIGNEATSRAETEEERILEKSMALSAEELRQYEREIKDRKKQNQSSDGMTVVEISQTLKDPEAGLGRFAYGAVPIFISALCFGLAHLGQGVAPIPLFLLGGILGYVYQRTHRVVPLIVAHACFNSLTYLQLLNL